MKYGTQSIFSGKSLKRLIKVEVDGKKIDLKAPYFSSVLFIFWSYLPSQDAASVVLLNIPSFASGTDLWGKAKEKDGFAPPSISDGLIEIVGIASTFHMGRIQVHENYTILANATHETMQNP
jgi:hypothetical protein